MANFSVVHTIQHNLVVPTFWESKEFHNVALPVVLPTHSLKPFLFLILVVLLVLQKKFRRLPDTHPPIVHLTEDEIFETPRQSYEGALEKYGSIVAIKRKGILEYIVSREHTRQVLTDDASFSFEQGAAFTLNINFMLRLSKGGFFRQVDTLVQEGVTARMDAVIAQVYPIFHHNALRALKESKTEPINMFEFAHRTVSQAMIAAILGEDYLESSMQELFIDIASGFAAMSGVTNNRSLFARRYPLLERLFQRCKYVWHIGFRFVFKLAPAVYRDIVRLENEGLIPRDDEEKDFDPNKVTLIAILAKQQANIDGHVTWYRKIWMILLLVMLIFASVHQTASVMVWVVFELSKRPEYMEAIREETNALVEVSGHLPTVSYSALKRATHLDSFIREVMRTKGDTLNHIRVTNADVPLGGYIIPKGSPVLPLTSLSHTCAEYHGDAADVFDGFRYVEMDRPAAMTGPGYISFGLGRWACPGRHLAISEIKMMIMSMLSVSTPELVGGDYQVVDKLNITSVPPEGQLILNPLT